MKKSALIILVFFLSYFLLYSEEATTFKSEADYADFFAKTMSNMTREYLIKTDNPKYNRHADMVSDEYAIEVDYHDKSYEAVGQALYYALMTKRKPGMLIILRIEKAKEGGASRRVDDKSLSDLNEILKVAELYKITTWTIDETGYIETKLQY